MLSPLVGVVSFYNDKEELITEIDQLEYDELTKQKLMQMIQELEVCKVILKEYYHNYDLGQETVLYEKNTKQT